MGMTRAFRPMALLILLLSTASLRADQLADAQKAVDDADMKLQRAIEADPRVIAARRRVEQAQTTLDKSINLSPALLKLATQRYQEAQAAEETAVKAAAPNERAILAQRQKDLLAIRQAAPVSPETRKSDDTASGGSAVIEPQRTGDVEVRLLHARIAPVSYTPAGSTQVRPSDPLLGILVEVKNLGAQPIEYIGWNSNGFATDSSDKQYLPSGAPGGTILGRVVSASLPPGASIKDLIVLQRPPEKKELTVTLPAFNLGGSGAVQFHLTPDKIELKTEPLLSSTTANPKVVLAPAPRPKSGTTQVAAGPPGASGRSADGVDFPPITDPAAKKDRAHGVSRLHEVCDLLLCPPAKLGFPVFSVDKSAAKLKEPMSHSVAVAGVRARGVTLATRIEQDQLDPACQFFALNFANAAVAGFEVRNGVVSRIVNYYKSTDAAQRMLMISYGQAPAPNSAPNNLAVEV